MSACSKACPVWADCGYLFKGSCDCVLQRKFKAKVFTLHDAGFEPGGYLCQCWSCGIRFGGDKHAIRCLACASVFVDLSLNL